MASSQSIYTHRCSLPNRILWFGKAVLYEDQVVVKGWTWRGRYRREIAIDDIDEVEWRPRPTKPNLILHLDEGQVFPLRLREGAGLWNAKLHDLLDESLLEDRGLPQNGHAEAEDSSGADEVGHEEDEDQEAT